MRVAVVVPGFSANAEDWAIPALLTLARSLSINHKFDIHVFSQRYPSRGTRHFDGLTHHAVGGGQQFGLASLKIWLQTSRAIAIEHKKNPFDLLHAFWVDEAGFSAVVAGAYIKRPVVASLGGGELTRLPEISYGAQRFLSRRLLTRYTLKKAALVTAGSIYQLDLARAHGVAERRLRLAPLGVDTNRFQPKISQAGRLNSGSPTARLPGSEPCLVQAASLLPVKNQALLLETLSLIKKMIPTIKLNLVGSGPLQKALVSLARRLDLNSHVVWYRHIPHPNMPEMYQQAHLYVQTSRHEAQGMAVLEAMACGLPAAGTPVGALKEVAFAAPQTSKEALAGQIIEILRDPGYYLELSRGARQLAELKYSLPVTTANFAKIYDDAIERGSRKQRIG